jgi:aminoglycoside 3-N-acetyltransferase
MVDRKKEINIANSFKSVGVLSSDVVMIHGDAGVAAQMIHIDSNQRIQELIRQIIEYFSPDGTVVVPTFSYSFTKNENFEADNTPSEIGKFSESFRRYPLIRRSNHPIFSVAGIGNHFEKFENSRIDDCFGDGTAFDLLYKLGGKIICLGCDFDRVTFAHYVEQYFEVPYRYMKNFSGYIIKDGNQNHLTTSYYVRKLDINYVLDLNFLKKELINQKKLFTSNVGRFPILATKTQDFLDCSIQLLKNNKFALTKNEI